ncbi:MAG: peptidoglycan DD-metalloendopeptidase family protein [Rhizobiales bacterium]|nr:peptidoglycan DD-metalloendopeptidase family protein [Hyphomicrobiales bacterium]
MIRALIKNLMALLVLTVAVPANAQGAGATQVRQSGRTYTQWLYNGVVDLLWPRLAPKLQAHFATPEGLHAFIAQIKTQLGRETSVVRERTLPWLDGEVYHRTATFSRFPGPVWVQWTIAPDGVVQGLLVKPEPAPAPSRHLDYQTRTPLRLPFAGEWFVFWGGRSVMKNYHAAAPDQRFAYDFLVAREGGTHSGDPSSNQSYFCFGEPILAPGDGTVVAVEGSIADNIPAQMNYRPSLGNHVIIDHGNGEHSFLAHLQRGSVQVKLDDTVRSGNRLGRCGNSGRSSEPHLHYHLQTTPRFRAGEGLPAQFLDYQADGKTVARGEPTRGQMVAP